MIFSYLKHRKFLILIAVYGLILVVNAIGFNFWMPSCPIKSFTGHECLGCGTNRALISLMKFDVPQAWQFNKLIFLYLPVAAFYMVHDFYKYSIKYTRSKQINNYGKI